MNRRAVVFTVKFVIFIAAFLLCAVLLWTAAERLNTKSAVNEVEPRRVIVIDPGHGGMDGGAVGISGSIEKDINFSVALRLADLLKLCGVDHIMTRSDDIMLELEGTSGTAKGRDIKSRVMIANEDPDNILVSIHTNSYPIEKYSGFQVFYSRNAPESRMMAEAVQQSCRSYLQPSNDREIKEASAAIYLMHHVENPAILVECGFISNTAEEALLRENEYQTSVAATICAGLLEHLSVKEGNENEST